MRPELHLLRLSAVLLILTTSAAAPARTEDANTIHWAYSTWFGNGWYTIGDDRDVFVVRYAPSRTLREAALEEDGERTVGVELRFPVTAGLNHFPLDNLRGSVDFENLANLSVTPSVYWNVPMNERWSIRPFAALGWGTVLNGSESAWTYWTGLRSRYVLRPEKLNVALYNAVGYVGYSPSNDSSSHFWPITNALEFRYPPSFLRYDDEQLLLHWHVAHTYFQADLDVLRRDRESEPISDEWELGVAISRHDEPIRWWKLEFARLGLAYRFSTDGELQGVGLMFQSLFDE